MRTAKRRKSALAYRNRRIQKDADAFRAKATTNQQRSKLADQIAKAGRPPGDTCEICAQPPNGRGRLHFDHCHTTGVFRGWICHSCNIVLGHVKDSPARLQALINYLLR